MHLLLNSVFLPERAVTGRWAFYGGWRGGVRRGEVELVALVVVFVEEQDGLGGEVVDSHQFCGLHGGRITSRRDNPRV